MNDVTSPGDSTTATHFQKRKSSANRAAKIRSVERMAVAVHAEPALRIKSANRASVSVLLEVCPAEKPVVLPKTSVSNSSVAHPTA